MTTTEQQPWERLANALENLRHRLNLTPVAAYGAEGDEDLGIVFLAVDRFSETFSDEDCSKACVWILEETGMDVWT